MFTNRTSPTGYYALDILLGQNVRDTKGNLLSAARGFSMGCQYNIAGSPGAGKSTLVGDCAAYPIHIGYPLLRVNVFNTDMADWSTNRIIKLTDLEPEVVEEKFMVKDMCSVEDITNILVAQDKEYTSAKHKPVKVENIYTGDTELMHPYVISIIDTVTSLNSEANDVGENADKITANEAFLNAFRKLSSLIGVIGKWFNSNHIIIWTSHLKKNKPELGQRQATKEFKSSSSSETSHIPTRLRQLGSLHGRMSALDSQNLDSDKHPINMYGLEDIKSKSVYAVEFRAVKSRSGVENRTLLKFLFIDGKFDRTMSLLATAMDMGILQKKSGIYPSAENPSIFKDSFDAEEEKEIMGRRRKTALGVKGYSRLTNIVEARLLLNYIGEDESIIEAANELRVAIMQEMEDHLYYELETNNVSAEELTKNRSRLALLAKSFASIKRKEVLDPNDEVVMPAEVKADDSEEGYVNIDD